MTTMTALTSDTADHELLRQTHAGRADAFTALYRRHQGPLYRYALMRCGSSDTAADVVQEAFMGLLTKRFGFDPLRGQLQHFLFGVARNLILRMEEARQRHLALARFLHFQDQLARHPEQEVLQLPAQWIETEALRQQSHEGFLHHVGRHVCRAAAHQRVAVQGALVAPVQGREGVGAAGMRLAQQVNIGSGGVWWRGHGRHL